MAKQQPDANGGRRKPDDRTSEQAFKPERFKLEGRYVYRCKTCGAKLDRAFRRQLLIPLLPDRSQEAQLRLVIASYAPRCPPQAKCAECDAPLLEFMTSAQNRWDLPAVVFGPIALGGLMFLMYTNHQLGSWWWLATGSVVVTALLLATYGLVGKLFPLPDSRRLSSAVVEDPEARQTIGRSRWPVYLPAIVAIIGLTIPLLIRTIARLPLSDYCRPHVVAPGQSVRLWIRDHSIESISGDWGGRGSCLMTNTETGEVTRLLLSVVRQPEPTLRDPEDSSRPSISVVAHLPDDPGLVGKTINLDINLTVVYPEPFGHGKFAYRRAQFRQVSVVHVGTPEQAALDFWALWGGTGAAGAMTLLASVLATIRNYRNLRMIGRPEVAFDVIQRIKLSE